MIYHHCGLLKGLSKNIFVLIAPSKTQDFKKHHVFTVQLAVIRRYRVVSQAGLYGTNFEKRFETNSVPKCGAY